MYGLNISFCETKQFRHKMAQYFSTYVDSVPYQLEETTDCDNRPVYCLSLNYSKAYYVNNSWPIVDRNINQCLHHDNLRMPLSQRDHYT